MEPKVTRKAGRPKKENKEVESKELTEKEEAIVEVETEVEGETEVEDENAAVMSQEDMMQQMMAMKEELETLKETAVKKTVVAPPKVLQKHICCEIKCKFDDMERARRVKFNELKDNDNSVTLRCPISGVSIRYRNLDEWPRDDQRIYSGGVDGWFVKYTIL